MLSGKNNTSDKAAKQRGESYQRQAVVGGRRFFKSLKQTRLLEPYQHLASCCRPCDYSACSHRFLSWIILDYSVHLLNLPLHPVPRRTIPLLMLLRAISVLNLLYRRDGGKCPDARRRTIHEVMMYGPPRGGLRKLSLPGCFGIRNPSQGSSESLPGFHVINCI